MNIEVTSYGREGLSDSPHYMNEEMRSKRAKERKESTIKYNGIERYEAIKHAESEIDKLELDKISLPIDDELTRMRNYLMARIPDPDLDADGKNQLFKDNGSINMDLYIKNDQAGYLTFVSGNRNFGTTGFDLKAGQILSDIEYIDRILEPKKGKDVPLLELHRDDADEWNDEKFGLKQLRKALVIYGHVDLTAMRTEQVLETKFKGTTVQKGTAKMAKIVGFLTAASIAGISAVTSIINRQPPTGAAIYGLAAYVIANPDLFKSDMVKKAEEIRAVVLSDTFAQAAEPPPEHTGIPWEISGTGWRSIAAQILADLKAKDEENSPIYTLHKKGEIDDIDHLVDYMVEASQNDGGVPETEIRSMCEANDGQAIKDLVRALSYASKDNINTQNRILTIIEKGEWKK